MTTVTIKPLERKMMAHMETEVVQELEPGVFELVDTRHRIRRDGYEIWYVGWGNTNGRVPGPYTDLGIGSHTRQFKGGWLWHFCFGFVSGFPVKDIFYYLLTRHTFKSVRNRYVEATARRQAAERQERYRLQLKEQAVILKAHNLTNQQIAELMELDESTVRNLLKD